VRKGRRRSRPGRLRLDRAREPEIENLT
jgi:hypothetical protein